MHTQSVLVLVLLLCAAPLDSLTNFLKDDRHHLFFDLLLVIEKLVTPLDKYIVNLIFSASSQEL